MAVHDVSNQTAICTYCNISLQLLIPHNVQAQQQATSNQTKRWAPAALAAPVCCSCRTTHNSCRAAAFGKVEQNPASLSLGLLDHNRDSERNDWYSYNMISRGLRESRSVMQWLHIRAAKRCTCVVCILLLAAACPACAKPACMHPDTFNTSTYHTQHTAICCRHLDMQYCSHQQQQCPLCMQTKGLYYKGAQGLCLTPPAVPHHAIPCQAHADAV